MRPVFQLIHFFICIFRKGVSFAKFVLMGLLLTFAAGHQTVLVHHQTGLAAVTVTTLGYQISHLTAAKVPGPVSQHAD